MAWGYPAAALDGSHAAPRTIAALARRFRRVLLALDNDAAGHQAMAALVAGFATHGVLARPITYPQAGDIGELARLPAGRELFARAHAAALAATEGPGAGGWTAAA